MPRGLPWFKKPAEEGHQYAVFGMDVDTKGHLWFGELRDERRTSALGSRQVNP